MSSYYASQDRVASLTRPYGPGSLSPFSVAKNENEKGYATQDSIDSAMGISEQTEKFPVAKKIVSRIFSILTVSIVSYSAGVILATAGASLTAAAAGGGVLAFGVGFLGRLLSYLGNKSQALGSFLFYSVAVPLYLVFYQFPCWLLSQGLPQFFQFTRQNIACFFSFLSNFYCKIQGVLHVLNVFASNYAKKALNCIYLVLDPFIKMVSFFCRMVGDWSQYAANIMQLGLSFCKGVILGFFRCLTNVALEVIFVVARSLSWTKGVFFWCAERWGNLAAFMGKYVDKVVKNLVRFSLYFDPLVSIFSRQVAQIMQEIQSVATTVINVNKYFFQQIRFVIGKVAQFTFRVISLGSFVAQLVVKEICKWLGPLFYAVTRQANYWKNILFNKILGVFSSVMSGIKFAVFQTASWGQFFVVCTGKGIQWLGYLGCSLIVRVKEQTVLFFIKGIDFSCFLKENIYSVVVDPVTKGVVTIGNVACVVQDFLLVSAYKTKHKALGVVKIFSKKIIPRKKKVYF